MRRRHYYVLLYYLKTHRLRVAMAASAVTVLAVMSWFVSFYSIGSRANEVHDPNNSDSVPIPSAALSDTDPVRPETERGISYSACGIRYEVLNEWDSGFITEVTLINSTSEVSNGWEISWDFNGTQEIINLWNGQLTQEKNRVTVTNAAWNRSISPGGSTSFGFQAGYSGSNPVPEFITVNGTRCEADSDPFKESGTPSPELRTTSTITEAPGTPEQKEISASPSARPGATGCIATYSIRNQWRSGFTADVTIKNTGDLIDSWTVAWTFPGNQKITNMWNAVSDQSGQNVQATSVSYNRKVDPGSTLNFGFNGSYSTDNGVPQDITLNGTSCRVTDTTAETRQVPQEETSEDNR